MEAEVQDPPRGGGLRYRIAALIAAQEGQAMLWAPVALTFGIWTYFGLDREPGFALTLGTAATALALFVLGRRSGPVILLALVLTGFVIAKARSEWVATPLLHATTDELAITGRVEDVNIAGKRQVLIVAPSTVAGMTAADIPRRLRLSGLIRQGTPLPGDALSAKARLSPLPGPVMPGGFDFGRQQYFESVGGAGRITSDMTITPGDPSISLRLQRSLTGVRLAINARINAVLAGDAAAVAEALIDGERGTISKPVNTSFQVSGLAHVLSISGLHMSLVAGGVFWLVRALLALIPPLALTWPIKKFSAAAAMLAGLFYMLLAGSNVATQRSYVMIAIVFFAILVDRPALSLRNLAIAAIIILALQPEAAIEAGFQMSFLAVLGLAAGFEAWAQWRRRRDDEYRHSAGLAHRTLRKISAAAATSLVTTVIAGAMSSIPAAYHFGRIAPYGVLANGLGIPVVSFVVMPAGLAAALLMPMGLEYWPLKIMGWGLDTTIAISDWVASLRGARAVLPQQPAIAAMLTAFGAAVLCLVRGRARLAGLAVIAVGAALGAWRDPPDILVNRTASNVAFVDASGNLVPAAGRRDSYAVGRWLTANGEEATPAEAAKRPGWQCQDKRCQAVVKGRAVAYVSDGVKLPLDCNGIAILIAAFPLRNACPHVSLRIDRFDVWRDGAMAIRITDDAVATTTARSQQGERPWVVVPRPRTNHPFPASAAK